MDELTLTIIRIREIEEEQAALATELSGLKELVKGYMKEQGIRKLRVDKYNVSYAEYSTHRFDSIRFKAEHPEQYSQYLKASMTERLTISLAKK